MFFMGRKNKEIKYNILSKLYFANVIVVLAIFGIITCAVSWKYQSVKEEILHSNTYFQNLISSRNEAINAEFAILEKYISNNVNVITLFKYALGDADEYDNWYLLGKDGKILFSAVDETKEEFINFFLSKPWKNTSRSTNGLYISKFSFSYTGNPVRFAIKELGDGRILVAKVKYDFLLNELIEKNKISNTKNFIVETDGKIVFDTDTKLLLGQKNIVDKYTLKTDYLYDKNIQISLLNDESTDLFVFGYVDNSKIAVVSRYQILQILKENFYIIVFGVLVLMASILVIFANVRFAKNQILRPIQIARSMIRKIHRGEDINQYADSGYITELSDIVRGVVQIYLETEKKRAIYLEYERKFGYLFEQGPFMILLIDAKTGDIVDISQKVIEFYGFSRDEFLRKSFYDLNKIKNIDTCLDGNNGSLSYETVHEISSGELKNIRVSIKNIEVSDDVKYAFCVLEDITRESLLAKNIQKENEKNIHSPILSLTWSTGLFKHISSISPNVKEFLGYGADEILDTRFTFTKIIYSEDLPALVNEINIKLKLFAETKRQRMESLRPYRIVRKNGDIVLCNIFIKFLLNDENNVDEIIGYIVKSDLIRSNLSQQTHNFGIGEEGQTPIFKWEFDCANDEIKYTKSLAKYLGYKDVKFEMKLLEYMHEEDVGIFKSAIEESKKESSLLDFELRLIRANGEAVWFDMSIYDIRRDEQQNPILIKGFFKDINYKRIADKYKRIVQNLFAYSNEAIAVVATDGKFLDVNDVFCNVTGYEKSEIIGQTPALLKSGVHDAVFYANLWKDLIKDGSWKGKIYNKRKNGEVYLEVLTISTIYDIDGTIEYFLTIFSDVTTAKARELELKKIAYYDVLTGLPNKLMLDQTIDENIENTKNSKNLAMALVIVDVDEFKPINELYGHQVGDKFLVKFSQLLQARLSPDQLLFRIGADEFAIFIKDIRDKSRLGKILDELMKVTNLDIQIDDRRLNISASMGASLYSSDLGIDKNALFNQADRALYKAKLYGKNYYEIFEPNFDVFLESSALCDAIKQSLDNEDFSLLYQPVINIKTGLVDSFESFIRWKYGSEILSYERINKFIIKYDIYEDITIWNIKKVLIDQGRLNELYGLDLRVSVDVSFDVLYKESFWSKFRVLASGNSNINRLELNIQGLRDARDYDSMENILDEYKFFGVTLALDDFSSSQNSLKILRDERVKKVKISEDLSLGVISGADNLIILRSALSICEMFQKTIVAKGVETSETMYFLIKAGYENLQGGFIGSKMPVNQIKKWFDEYGIPDRFKDITKLTSEQINQSSLAVMHRIWIRALLGMLSSVNYKNFKPRDFAKDYSALVIADYNKQILDPAKLNIHKQITKIIMEILDGIEQFVDVSSLIIDLKAKRDDLLDLE